MVVNAIFFKFPAIAVTDQRLRVLE